MTDSTLQRSKPNTGSVLGALKPAEFLRDYWQQKPLLVRDACPNFVSPLSADELAGLATEPDVESRIFVENLENESWQLLNGPFTDATFAELPPTHWTLLVQAIDLWVPEVNGLLERFDFIPKWRRDDLMVSFAPKGGSVGPHFDQYDVFLLQVEGERRWQIGDACDANTPLAKGTDLKIVDEFVAHSEWLLKPGDMLYLPPNIAHWGVAESDCLTFSIGFRSPLLSDMLGDLALEIDAGGGVNADQRYRDPPLTPNMANQRIDPAFVAQAKRQLLALIDNDELIADWLARYMTAPKYPELLDETGEDRRASVGARIYKNGESDQ